MGGNSGPGSYNRLARFKSSVINDFVLRNGIDTVIEFGCGDGNQLKLAKYPRYFGVDVSHEAIRRCQSLFAKDRSKTFRTLEEYESQSAELALSLDVVYHLVEDDVFVQHMSQLFNAAEKHVIVYSTNHEEVPKTPSHVRHRRFSDFVDRAIPDWHLVQHIENPYPFDGDFGRTSLASFYIYGKDRTHSNPAGQWS